MMGKQLSDRRQQFGGHCDYGLSLLLARRFFVLGNLLLVGSPS